MAGKRVTKVAWVPAGTHPDVPGGHYRHVPDDGDPLSGDLVVWIDEAPDDPEDGSGHFEVYDGKPADYASAQVPAQGDTVALSGTTAGSSSTQIGAS